MTRNPKIAVIGLGKLGTPMVGVFAEAGIDVVGVDLRPEVVEAVANGHAPVEEPGLESLLTANRVRIRATTGIAEAVAETDFSFVIVPTPSNADGLFTNAHVLKAIQSIGQGLRQGNGRHVVVVTSTVLPGSMDREIAPRLEQASGLRVGRDVGLCYNPEFIALGSVIRDMRNPDLVLIGESDPESGAALEAIQRRVVTNAPRFRHMNFVNAELAKIALNTFVTTKISFANMLAEMCERLPGADVDDVTEAIGADSRIGTKYLRGGMGYGGPCFPRDSIAFSSLAQSLGAKADLAEATDRTNRHQIDRLCAVVMREAAGSHVAILGLSYKPFTDVVEESQGALLANRLAESGIKVTVYDPVAMPTARKVLDKRVEFAASAQACVAEAKTAVIATAWPEFERFDPSTSGLEVVVDCWRMLPIDSKRHARVVYLGTGNDHGAPVHR